jgi:site-specific DNA recombinase
VTPPRSLNIAKHAQEYHRFSERRACRLLGQWRGTQRYLATQREVRKLIPHPTEATLVRNISVLYLKFRSVRKLVAHLNRENVKTKTWVTKAGTRLGGRFARGHVYYLLRNRLYVGEIRHPEHW